MTSAYALLFTAVVALLLGPLAYVWSERSAKLRSLVDGVAVVSVGGLALLRLAPEAIAEGGFVSALLIILGAGIPRWLHRWTKHGSTLATDGVLVLALAVHAAVESAALATLESTAILGFGLAITAHRLPVGLAVFSIPDNDRAGWIAVLVLVGATLFGFFAGHEFAATSDPVSNAWLHAFVCGSLLHVLGGHEHGRHDSESCTIPTAFAEQEAPSGGVPERARAHAHVHGNEPDATHGHAHGEDAHGGHAHGGHGGHPHQSQEFPGFSLVGALLGGALVSIELMRDHHHHGEHLEEVSFNDTLFSLMLESAPALLIGYLLAGLVGALLSPRQARWLKGGTSLSQALRGVAFGLPMPICSCGVVPVFETLVRRGVPAAAAFAFLVATPELGIDAILLSIPLLGGELALARLGAAFLVALVAGLVLSRALAGTPSLEEEPLVASHVGLRERLTGGLRFGLGDLFDHTIPWIVIGIIVAALVEPLLGNDALSSLPSLVQVPIFALIGIPSYVCASGATPLAAIAIHQGISPGAALAFLIAGPATNVTTFGVLSRLHGKRTALLFGTTLTVSAVLVGWGIDWFSLAHAVEDADHHDHHASFLQLGSLGALGLLFLASFVRQGPRGMLRQVTDNTF